MATLFHNHDFERADLHLALNLVADHPALGLRDCVHAAAALRRAIPVIVTPDLGFASVAGLERLDPTVALERLTS